MEFSSTRDIILCWFPFVCTGICKKQVIRKLKDGMETLIVGDPLDKNTDIGAKNSKDQLEPKYI